MTRQESINFKPYEKSTALALVLILLIATALRLYALNTGLWLDEMLTDVLFAKLPLGSILTTFESENQHFLYSILAHFSIAQFGDTPWALRLPAALFGIGSIWALFLLGREVAGTKEALLSAMLLTLSYTHIWFSQNARGYSGLLFWAIISSWVLLRALNKRTIRLWLLYAVCAALGVYTHMTMLFVILGQFITFGWFSYARFKSPRAVVIGLFTGFGLAALITVALYAPVLLEILGGMGREVSVVNEWKNPLWTVLEIVRGLQTSFAGGLVATAALAVFGIGLVSYARTRFELVVLLIIPAVAGTTLVIGLGHHLWPRFFFFTMGFATLVVIRGAIVMGSLAGAWLRLGKVKSSWLGASFCVGLIAVSAFSVPAAYGPKQDYSGALKFLEENQEPGDAIVITGLAEFPYKQFYQKNWIAVNSVADLNTVQSNAKRVWLVYTFPTVLEATSPEIMAAISGQFRTVRQFEGTVGDGTVFVCVDRESYASIVYTSSGQK